jgi:multidrug efflux pump subunit AcrA (membrane-fusion protein)
MNRLNSGLILFIICAFFNVQVLLAGTAATPTNVKVMVVSPAKLKLLKSYIGHLKPLDRVAVRSETSGTVERITFDEGEKVKSGEVLVHISTKELELRKTIAQTNYQQSLTDYQIEKQLYFNTDGSNKTGSGATNEHVSLKKLQLQVAMAKAGYDHALSEYKVQERLFAKKMTSAVSFDSYKTSLDIKQITWQQAILELDQARIKDKGRLNSYENAIRISEMNLKLAGLELEKSKVKAPFNGIVKEKTVQMGGFIEKGSDLLEIMDISKVLAHVSVSEKEMRYVAVGNSVSVRLDALPGEEFNGRIKTLGLEADLKCRCFPADIIIDNPERKLLPGMMARVTMLAKSESKQVIIPRHAVLEQEQGSIVYIVKEGIAVQRKVVTGEMVQENIQITSGLEFGDLLIVVGQNLIANKEPVKIINKNKKIVQKIVD